MKKTNYTGYTEDANGILKLEKEKIAMEVENMKLINKKLKIELQQL